VRSPGFEHVCKQPAVRTGSHDRKSIENFRALYLEMKPVGIYFAIEFPFKVQEQITSNDEADGTEIQWPIPATGELEHRLKSRSQ
jgi:hypothetical protein